MSEARMHHIEYCCVARARVYTTLAHDHISFTLFWPVEHSLLAIAAF